MAYKQYDPKKVAVSVGGVPIVGLMSVVFDFANDKRSMHIGTDGNGRHIKSADESGTCKVEITSYSPSNAALLALDLADEPIPIVVMDKSSSADLATAESCTLRKIPPMTKGAEETPLEWLYQFTKGKIVHSGAEE